MDLWTMNNLQQAAGRTNPTSWLWKQAHLKQKKLTVKISSTNNTQITLTESNIIQLK